MIYAQLRAFLAAARCGSFSEGARVLKITQPSISKQIRDLEERCGEPLFDRIGRQVRLTPLGLQVMTIARRMIDAELDALQVLTDVKAVASGHLRIAAVGPYHLMEILSAFNRRYPRVRVSIEFGHSRHVEEAVNSFDADLGVLARQHRVDGLASLCYRQCPLLLSVPRGHRLASCAVIHFDQLESEWVIHRESGSSSRQIFEAACRAAGVPIHSVLEIGSREAIRIAVANGLGVSYVSRDEAVTHDTIVYVPFADPGAVMTNATLIWRKDRQANTLIEAFLDTAQGLLQTPQAVGA
ncbi:LysR substrate-binding domain-containing protein [Pseudomonas sp. R5(2019)]|uniref:LysR substrate-binding domain-containing protein n=1 Tax=Pseudomonas sp. R5(2019) TaxID=2697566 RepID=UPI001412B061|nr:LysR substrate-binding domain-containing protein [Pseudomonas sp. R5(2019)]NBA95859.1 LysR family transcriptional regulator [Pseudomonas sp. R5(2019)]